MIWFFIALGVFLGSHLISSVPQCRSFFISLLGERVYLVFYSILSLVTLWWVFHTARNTSMDFILWPKVYWTYWVTNITMPLVCVLVSLGINTPNSLSILCKQRPFDPGKPRGIVSITRHPILWALFLWSFSHIFPNGCLSLVIVFGIFALFSILGMKLVDLRLQKLLGQEHWETLSKNTSILPFCAVLRSRQGMNWQQDDLYSVIVGLGIYYLVLNLHEYIIGVNPLQFIL
ncbi:MAG: NnrU family protein [Alphaproteobacteria bacterium]|nr:NnrU family protein [Alphaproteobacteria bacterium]